MKRDTKLLMVLFGAILITSGCMETSSSETSTEAIAVNDFSFSVNPVPSSQSNSLQMELENVGDAEAEDVTARVFGPTIGSSDRTWTAEDGRSMEFSNLNPARENQPAVPRRQTLSFTTPSLEQGRNIPYTFNAQLFYGYETTASTDLEIMSQERFQETSTAQSQASASNSNGPIQITTQASTPVVFYPDDSGTRTEEFCVTVNNRGTGTPFNPDALPVEGNTEISDEDEGQITLEIENVGNIVFTADEGQSIENGNAYRTEVDIIGSEGFQCFDMELTGLGTQINQLEQSANIEITASYGYQEETSTSVTVEGRGRESDSSDDGSDDSGDDDDSGNNDGPTEAPGGIDQ